MKLPQANIDKKLKDLDQRIENLELKIIYEKKNIDFILKEIKSLKSSVRNLFYNKKVR